MWHLVRYKWRNTWRWEEEFFVFIQLDISNTENPKEYILKQLGLLQVKVIILEIKRL